MTIQNTPGPRKRSAHKRAAILGAARELFLTDGYERTSVDAISARADVSKRTVYDHFGDKGAVFSAVANEAGESLMASVRAAIDEELTDERGLDRALLGFARRIATDTFSSSEYAVFRKLLTNESGRFPIAGQLRDAPEMMLVERFETLARAGRIHATNPHRAAEHFIALTFLLALDALGPSPWSELDNSDIDEILVDGVNAFLRAYTPV